MIKAIGLISASLATAGQAIAAPQSSIFVDVAIYRAEQKITSPTLTRKVIADISAMPEFISSIHLQSIAEPEVFADIIVWQSASLKPTEGAFSNAIFADLGELELFDRFQSTSKNTTLQPYLQPGAVIELAAYSVNDIAVQTHSRPAVYLELQNSSSFYGGMALSSVKADTNFIDLISWSSQHDAEQTAANIMAMSKHQDFFKNNAEIKLFDYFTVYAKNGLKNDM